MRRREPDSIADAAREDSARAPAPVTLARVRSAIESGDLLDRLAVLAEVWESPTLWPRLAALWQAEGGRFGLGRRRPMRRRMQAKDVPEWPVLEHLARHAGHWCNWADWPAMPAAVRAEHADLAARSVRLAMPAGTPGKVVLAKMRALMRRRLVDGCGCGCRGDFELTDAGRAHLAALRARAKAGEP